MTEDEMVGWHHQLNGHEFEQPLGVSDGQGSLACCSPWDLKEGHNLATEQQQHVASFSKKMVQMNLFTKQKQSHRCRKQTSL